MHKTKQVTFWRQMTADDDETTSSVRRLIDVIVTSQPQKSQWSFHDVCQYHSQFNGSVQVRDSSE